MARTPEGWHVYQDPRSGVHQARFTHEGRRYSVSTGERDPVPAAKEAARIYAEVVSGGRSPGKALIVPAGKALDEVA